MNEQTDGKLKRPPVVVVVGHVDHGKTSLLDYVRKTNIVAKEAGGITQSVGAYEITHMPQNDADETQKNAENSVENTGKIQRNSASSQRSSAESNFANGRKITFIDTPGHEAFSKMRARGAHVADVAILVVAADEGVKPQTKEALKALLDSETPFVVALTKIDKSTADVERVKSELGTNGVFLEGFGGNISYQAISSKTGEGVNELLDLIMLTADMEDLSYDPDAKASGIILEAKLENRRGNTVTVILKNGTLKQGDMIVTASAKGKIKVLENFLGKTAKELIPSSPAVIFGFEELPAVGEEFTAGKFTDKELDAVKKIASTRVIGSKTKDDQTVRLILKADVAGSLEALNDLLKEIPITKGQRLEIISQSVGEISDGDVKDALATGAFIIGFRTPVSKAAENLARVHDISIVSDDIIYKLVELIEKMFFDMREGKYSGELEILAVFSAKENIQTIGGKVNKGRILNKAWLEVKRSDQVLGKGKVVNLQQMKKDANVVNAGNECGLIFDCPVKIEVGDLLLQQ